MSTAEIWSVAKENGLADQLDFPGDRPDKILEERIRREDLLNGQSDFVLVSEYEGLRVRLSDQNENFQDSEAESRQKRQGIGPCYEDDYYPLLVHFAQFRMNFCFTKKLKVPQMVKGKWLHPDLVGVKFGKISYTKDVFKISEYMYHPSCELISFELKRHGEINTMSGLRMFMPEAVANSSWANSAYLAAPELPPYEKYSFDQNVRNWYKEAKMLSEAHGIGIIHLDTKDPHSSKIVFPAKVRNNQNWDLMNKLAFNNPSFRQFLEQLRKDLGKASVSLLDNEGFYKELIDSGFYERLWSEEQLVKFYENGCKDTDNPFKEAGPSDDIGQ